MTFDSNVSFWTSLAEAFGINQSQTVTGIAPLVQVDYADRNMSVDDFSEKYYVAKSQVVDLQKKLRETYHIIVCNESSILRKQKSLTNI